MPGWSFNYFIIFHLFSLFLCRIIIIIHIRHILPVKLSQIRHLNILVQHYLQSCPETMAGNLLWNTRKIIWNKGCSNFLCGLFVSYMNSPVIVLLFIAWIIVHLILLPQGPTLWENPSWHLTDRIKDWHPMASPSPRDSTRRMVLRLDVIQFIHVNQ